MSAPILLSHYRVKNKKASHRVKRESETPVTLGFMHEFRAEMMSRFLTIDAQFVQVDAKFEQVNAEFKQMNAKFDQVNAELKQMNAKLDQTVAEMKMFNHRTMLLMEEQNLRNRQAYDGYAIVYGALQDLKSQLKPECFKDK